MSKNKFSELDKLHNFIIHARGNYVVISAFSDKKVKYTFLASTPMLEYILYDMNQRVTLGALSKCQLGGIYMALRNIKCEYDLVIINDRTTIIPRSKEKGFQRKRIQVK